MWHGVQDYEAEQQQYLEEQRFYDEKGELNEQLLARPDDIREEDYADPEMEENALFVPVSFLQGSACRPPKISMACAHSEHLHGL